MKHIGKITGLLGMGALLIAFNLGGVAGCGDSNGGSGGGGGVSNSDATAAALTTVLGSLTAFTDTSSTAALVAKSEQAGLKAVTSTCSGDPDTSITCDCEGGGSFTFAFGSSDDTISFDNCVDVDGNTLNGDAVITSTTSGATIDFNDFTATLVDCGSYTLNGTEEVTDNGDNTSDIVINLTATTGGDTVNIDGNLTGEADDTISGNLDYTGAVSISCTFNHDNLDDCNNFADACGIAAADICVGTEYRSDVCE